MTSTTEKVSMPKGISTEVEGGYVYISFPDPSKRGPALAKLLEGGSPVDVDTGGRRRRYRVPEGNARAAGLIDEVKPAPKMVSAPTKETTLPPVKKEIPSLVKRVVVPAAKKAAPA